MAAGPIQRRSLLAAVADHRTDRARAAISASARAETTALVDVALGV